MYEKGGGVGGSDPPPPPLQPCWGQTSQGHIPLHCVRHEAVQLPLQQCDGRVLLRQGPQRVGLQRGLRGQLKLQRLALDRRRRGEGVVLAHARGTTDAHRTDRHAAKRTHRQ